MATLESPAPAGRPGPPSAGGGGDVLGVRVAAALIDLAILLALIPLVGVATGGVGAQDGEIALLVDTTGLVVYVALVFLYFMVLESTLGRTVGKLLLGLHVVGWQGDRPSVVAVAIRTILRAVDWLPLLYVVGFASMILTGARRRRLGDLAAETRVERTAPVRHRGLYAALLAIALFGVVAVPAVSASSGLLSEVSSSSSACVFDRCNVTAQGDQVMDLSGHVVGVRDIDSGSDAGARATFTVAGHEVTVWVGETRQVGPSLIHLASVDGDVAQFSVDLSGLFVDRADLRGTATGRLSTYTSYTEVTDDQGVVTVEVPAEWDDVDGRQAPEYGPSIRAAPDLEEFGRTRDAPGIAVEVPTRRSADDSGAVLDEFTGSFERCTSEGREDYRDRRHRGEIERWTACDGAGATVVAAALVPVDGGLIVRIHGQAVDARDLAALDRAIATVRVDAPGGASSDAGGSSEAAPPGTTVTEAEWIEQVATLRTDIDDAMGGDAEITASALEEWADAMRRCSRLLAAAPSSDRTERLRDLVQEACAHYDDGADCLLTAAEIGSPEVGSAEDARLTDALDCGFDGLNRGGELLIDAEIAAEDLQAARPR